MNAKLLLHNRRAIPFTMRYVLSIQLDTIRQDGPTGPLFYSEGRHIMNSIYDAFQTIESINSYVKNYAIKLNLDTHAYYYDNKNKIKISQNKHITTWQEFKSYPEWRIRFNLTRAKYINNMGIDNYILLNKELSFVLTIKGYSILYIIRFYDKDEGK